MTPERFHHLFEQPNTIRDSDIADITELATDYPWFQAAHALLLKAYLNQGSFRYKQNLNNIALLTGDRSNLYKWLHEEVEYPLYVTNKPVTETEYFEINTQQVSTKDLRQEENYKLKKHEVERILNEKGLLFFNYDDRPKKETEQAVKHKTLNERNIQKEIDKTSDELTLDTKDWLKQNLKRARKKHPRDKETTEREEQLIDKFIARSRKFATPEDIPEKENIDLSEKSVKDSSDFMTETMAKIYLKQGLYKKAIMTYEKLSLKYPEKNVYFAAQIDKIKRIINNQ